MERQGLLRFGYRIDYDWTQGTGMPVTGEYCFDFTEVETDRNIIQGQYYWLTFWCEGGGYVCPGRCGAPKTPAYPKMDAKVADINKHIPPMGSAYYGGYGDAMNGLFGNQFKQAP